MQTIQVLSLTKYAGADEILTDITLKLETGKKYGLIGANGCGKTTLLNILCGEDTLFEGTLQKHPALKIGYVKQNIRTTEEITVGEYLLREHEATIKRLRQAEEKLADSGCPDLEAAMEEYNKAREVYDRAELDLRLARLEGTLEALGLGGRSEHSLKTLSGGEKNRLALARALLEEPELLVLDEPGNHLDFYGLEWLESFLGQFKQSVLIVSHNRYLLDRVCDRIIEIENRGAAVYSGNYTAFRMEKLQHLISRQAEYNANRKRLDRLEQLVHKFREIAARTADPAWGKRLRARKTQLAKARQQAVERPELQERKLQLTLSGEKTRSNIALRITDYNRAFGSRVLFAGASLEMQCGEKVGLIGANGCGKSTLLGEIVREGHWDNPVLQVGPSQKIGYMAQHPDIFSPGKTIEEEIRGLGPLTRNDAFHLLSRFLFTWQDMDKQISQLSGGELNRLQLAVIFYHRPNFLILDEPTNHLDIPSREAVEEALGDFEGTLLVVSHDRYFLDKVIDRVVDVKEHGFRSHSGSFSEYWQAERLQRPQSVGQLTTGQAERSRQKANNIAFEALEARIMEEEARKTGLEKQIEQAFRAGDNREGRKLAAKLEKCVKLIDKLYADYE